MSAAAGPRFERLAVVGVGLLGGSFALACRQRGLVGEVVGVGRSRANLEHALARGIVDRAGDDMALVEGADLVLLAAPVASLGALAQRAAPYLRPGALVTDVGSVKERVVAACEAALVGCAEFVGSHPIAGSEQSGAGAARADLFAGATCVVTPSETTSPQALARTIALWSALGMRVTELPPVLHDALLARTSHLPHVLAFVLARLVGVPIEGIDPLALAGPSLIEGTRIAASSPELWRDILLGNAAAVVAACDAARADLERLRAAVAAGEGAAIATLVAEAGAVRARMRGPVSVSAAAADELLAPARTPLTGEVELPGDKSISHRALLFGAIAEGETRITGLGGGQDNASTIHVLRSLGVRITRRGTSAVVHGRGFAGLQAPGGPLDCGNSGTTMRLMTGLLAGRPFRATLRGDASLERRPMARVAAPLQRMGARIEMVDGRSPVTIDGGALHGEAHVLAVASAQLKTALVLAGLQAHGLTRVAEPELSRDHTERLLPSFGVAVERPAPLTIEVRGPARLRATEIHVPGDASAAAFWAVAASIVPGSRLLLRNVGVNPSRTGAFDVLRAMGAILDIRPTGSVGEEPVADIEVRHAPLHGALVAGATLVRAIDEFPALAVAAALATGTTEFRDGAELRVKESDRIAAMARGLATLGVAVHERPDGLAVEGRAELGSGEVDAFGDHRIAMAFAVAALRATGEVRIRGVDSAAVSDPGFLVRLRQLAGNESTAVIGERA